MSHWPEDKPYPITGIPPYPEEQVGSNAGATNGEEQLPVRRDIGQWTTSCPEDSIQVSLFIRAMQKFYDIPYDSKVSFFRVAGIHHYPPNCSWDGAVKPSECPDDNFKERYSYCTHNKLTFATWHRPYMLLFEQRLFELMLEAIGEMDFIKDDDGKDTEREAWVKEAYKWRLPYWDWALPDAALPFLFRHEQILIRQPMGPNGTLQAPISVQNPLFKYELKIKGKVTQMGDDQLGDFKILDDLAGDSKTVQPWSQCTATSRYGIKRMNDDEKTDTGYDGVNNYFMTNTAIKIHHYYNEDRIAPDKRYGLVTHSLGDLVYRSLVPSSPSNTKGQNGQSKDQPIEKSPGLSFRDFCCTQYTREFPPETWERYLSLEMIHNNMHNFIGGLDLKTGLGHMSDVPVAAFDPIFFMHHCNIDRLFAIWQTLYPDSWMDPADLPKSDTALPPFRKSDKDPIDYYNSDEVRDWLKLGYDYDVLALRRGEQRYSSSPGEASPGRERYIRRLRRYLNRTYQNTGQDIRKVPKKNIAMQGLKKDQFPDYIIGLLYDRYALEGRPYSIHFFLGEIDDASITSRTMLLAQDPRHIGQVYTFSGGPTDKCGNCKTQELGEVLSSALIPLTLALVKNVEDPNVDINTLDPDTVAAYLRDNLTWKAVANTGEIVSPDRIPKTRVFVLGGKADHNDDEEQLSDFFGYQPLPQATEGKPLGAEADNYEVPSDGLVPAAEG